jgi:hypothetical protein
LPRVENSLFYHEAIEWKKKTCHEHIKYTNTQVHVYWVIRDIDLTNIYNKTHSHARGWTEERKKNNVLWNPLVETRKFRLINSPSNLSIKKKLRDIAEIELNAIFLWKTIIIFSARDRIALKANNFMSMNLICVVLSHFCRDKLANRYHIKQHKNVLHIYWRKEWTSAHNDDAGNSQFPRRAGWWKKEKNSIDFYHILFWLAIIFHTFLHNCVVEWQIDIRIFTLSFDLLM